MGPRRSYHCKPGSAGGKLGLQRKMTSHPDHGYQITNFIATGAQLRYKSSMKGGPKYARRSAELQFGAILSARRLAIAPSWSSVPRTCGFSLIELLIVVALILILTTMYWGSTSG